MELTSLNSIFNDVQLLFRQDLIDGVTVDLIRQPLNIANHGVHGKKVSKEHIQFVEEVYPIVKIRLQKAFDELNISVCSRCKFVGYSKYGNVCPRCGFAHDDD